MGNVTEMKKDGILCQECGEFALPPGESPSGGWINCKDCEAVLRADIMRDRMKDERFES